MRSRRTAEEIVWHWGANHQSVLRRSDLLSIEVRQLRGKEANARLQKQTNKVKQQYLNRKRKQRGGASGAKSNARFAGGFQGAGGSYRRGGR